LSMFSRVVITVSLPKKFVDEVDLGGS